MVQFHAAPAKTLQERANTRYSPSPRLILHLEVKVEVLSFLILSSCAVCSANFLNVFDRQNYF